MRSDMSRGSGGPVVVLGLNVLAMAADNVVLIPGMALFLYKLWVNDQPRAGGTCYQNQLMGLGTFKPFLCTSENLALQQSLLAYVKCENEG